MKTVLKNQKITEFKFYSLEFYDQESNQLKDYDYKKLFCIDLMSKFVKINKYVYYLFDTSYINGKIHGTFCVIEKKCFKKDEEFIKENFRYAGDFLKKNVIKNANFILDCKGECNLALETTNNVLSIKKFISFIESALPDVGIDKYTLDINNLENLKRNNFSILDIHLVIKSKNIGSLKMIDSNLWKAFDFLFQTLNCNKINLNSKLLNLPSNWFSNITVHSLIQFIIKNPECVNNFEKLKIYYLNETTGIREYHNFFSKTNCLNLLESRNNPCDLEQIETKLEDYKQNN